MFTAGQIAESLKGEIIGNPDTPITGLKPANTASAGDLTFAENENYFAAACKTEAAALLVPDKFGKTDKTLIKVRNVRVALAQLLDTFHPERSHASGIHETAVVSESAEVDESAHIGPHAIVEAGAKIGPGQGREGEALRPQHGEEGDAQHRQGRPEQACLPGVMGWGLGLWGLRGQCLRLRCF